MKISLIYNSLLYCFILFNSVNAFGQLGHKYGCDCYYCKKDTDTTQCSCNWWWENPNPEINVDSNHYKTIVYFPNGKIKKEEIYSTKDSSMISGTCYFNSGVKCSDIMWNAKKAKFRQVYYNQKGKVIRRTWLKTKAIC